MNNNLIPYEKLGLTEARKEIIEKFIYYKEQGAVSRQRLAFVSRGGKNISV